MMIHLRPVLLPAKGPPPTTPVPLFQPAPSVTPRVAIGVDSRPEPERLAQARAAAANAAFLSIFRRIGRLEDRLAGLHSAKDPSAAVAEAAAVLAAARELGQPLPVANALRTQSQVLQAAGQPGAGIAPLQEAYALTSALEGDNARDVAISALSSLVYLHTVTGKLRQASELAGEAITRTEGERSRINAPYLQAAYLSNYLQLFVGAIFTAFKLDDHEVIAHLHTNKLHPCNPSRPDSSYTVPKSSPTPLLNISRATWSRPMSIPARRAACSFSTP